MKKYLHKSRKYRAIQNLYKTSYEICLLHDTKEGPMGQILYDCPADLIEESNDWIELVEVPVNEYFSRDEIISAAGYAKFSILANFRMNYPIKPGHLIDIFVAKLSLYLPKKF